MFDSSNNYQQNYSHLNAPNNHNNIKNPGAYQTRYFTDMNAEEDGQIVVEPNTRLTSLGDIDPPLNRVGRDITNIMHLSKKPFDNKLANQQICYPLKAPLANKNPAGHSRAISSILFAGKNNTNGSINSIKCTSFADENVFVQKQTAYVQSQAASQPKNDLNCKRFVEEISCEKENLYQPATLNQNNRISQFNIYPGNNMNIHGQKQCIQPQQILKISQGKIEDQYSGDISHQRYVKEIITHLKATESINSSRGGYLGTIQTEINERMRGILLDWLVDVHFKFKLRPETLYLAISLTDRYLEKVSIVSTQLQLLGITSLYIAAKYEEVYGVPHIKDLVYVCDNAYTKEELLQMEGNILLILKFDVLSVSPNRFLELFVLFEHELGEKNLLMAKYLLEIGLLEYKLIGISPSMLAASVLYLVNKIRKRPISWRQELVEASGFTEADIRPTAKQVCHIVQTIESRKYLASLKRKYSKQQFMEVAKIKIEQRKDTKSINENNYETNHNNTHLAQDGQKKNSTITQNYNNNQIITNNNINGNNGQQQQLKENQENNINEAAYQSATTTNTNNFLTFPEEAQINNVGSNSSNSSCFERNSIVPVESISLDQQQHNVVDTYQTSNGNTLQNNYFTTTQTNQNIQKPQIHPVACNSTLNELQLSSVQTLDIIAPLPSVIYLIEARIACLKEKPNKYIQTILASRLYSENAQPLSLKVPVNLIIQAIEKKVGNISTQQLWQLPAALAKLVTEAMLHTEKIEELSVFPGEFIDFMIESLLADGLNNQQVSQVNL